MAQALPASILSLIILHEQKPPPFLSLVCSPLHSCCRSLISSPNTSILLIVQHSTALRAKKANPPPSTYIVFPPLLPIRHLRKGPTNAPHLPNSAQTSCMHACTCKAKASVRPSLMPPARVYASQGPRTRTQAKKSAVKTKRIRGN